MDENTLTDWIIAGASLLSVIVAAISVYYFYKSLKLLSRQNAASDVAVFKERYEIIEDFFVNYKFLHLREDPIMRRFIGRFLAQQTPGSTELELNHYLDSLFCNINGVRYFQTFNHLHMLLTINPDYEAFTKSKEIDYDKINNFNFCSHLIKLWFLEDFINKQRKDIEKYLRDLEKSEISPYQKAHYYQKIRFLLTDYFHVLRKSVDGYSKDILYSEGGKLVYLIKDTSYPELATFILSMEPKFNTENM